MPIFEYFWPVASAFVIAVVLTPLTIKLAFRWGATDAPDTRKVHTQVMPRMGGLAIFLAFFLTLLVVVRVSGPFTGLLAGCALVFLTGWLDDMFGLSPLMKLLGQLAAAGVAVYFGIVIHYVTNPFNGSLDLGAFSIPLTLLWIVGITNAINLIDGLDGLAAGISAIAAATMGVIAFLQGQPQVALVAFVLVAAALGFLPFNFHPARTFMGDCGSNLLGFALGCLSVLAATKSTAVISLLVPIVVLGIPIFDTFFAIVRRVHNKTPIYLPDKAHLHHRLMALGVSHGRSVLIIYGISLLFSGIAVTLTLVQNSKASLALVLLLLLVFLAADRIGLLTGERRGTDPDSEVEAAKTRSAGL